MAYANNPNLRDFMKENVAATGLPLPVSRVKRPAIPNPTGDANGTATVAPAPSPEIDPESGANLSLKTGAEEADDARKARTGGGGFDPIAPAPDALSTISPSLGALATPGADASQLYQQPAVAARTGAGTPPPGPAGKVAGALTAALPGGLGVPATAPSGDPAGTPDLTYDPQNRGLPNTTGNPDVARAAATKRDAAISVYDAGNSALSQSGRPLGYGKQVNGVATFSDGSSGIPGLPGAIPRTMSDQQISDLGNRVNTISDANFVNPGAGVAASVATGGVATPMVGQLPQPSSYDPNAAAWNAQVDAENAQRGAASDITSIANEDPRSAAGIAARNLRLRTGGATAGRTSRYGYGPAVPNSYQQGLSALQQTALQPATAAAQRANTQAIQAGDTTRAGLAEQGQMARGVLAARENAAARVDAASINASRERVNGAITAAASREAEALRRTGMDPDEAEERGIAFAQRTLGGGGAASAPTKPTLEAFKAAAKKQGSKMSDADLQAAFNQRYGKQ